MVDLEAIARLDRDGAADGVQAATNPFLDDHLLNAVVLLALAACNAGAYLGLAKAWRSRHAFKDA